MNGGQHLAQGFWRNPPRGCRRGSIAWKQTDPALLARDEALIDGTQLSEIVLGARLDEMRLEVPTPDIGTLALVIDEIPLPPLGIAAQVEGCLLE